MTGNINRLSLVSYFSKCGHFDRFFTFISEFHSGMLQSATVITIEINTMARTKKLVE